MVSDRAGRATATGRRDAGLGRRRRPRRPGGGPARRVALPLEFAGLARPPSPCRRAALGLRAACCSASGSPPERCCWAVRWRCSCRSGTSPAAACSTRRWCCRGAGDAVVRAGVRAGRPVRPRQPAAVQPVRWWVGAARAARSSARWGAHARRSTPTSTCSAAVPSSASHASRSRSRAASVAATAGRCGRSRSRWPGRRSPRGPRWP